VLGEYIGRIYTETKGRPSYVIRERISQTDPGTEPAAPRTAVLHSAAVAPD
jgi:hypothetical protein